MIVICIIFTVIGSFICTLIKVLIDEWLVDLSMKRLSLKRDRCNKAGVTSNDPIEISDDDSFGGSLSSQINTEHEKCTNLTYHGTTNISNNSMDTSRYEHTVSKACSSKLIHVLSDDTKNDEDVIVIDQLPTTSHRKQSMFNWNKTYLASKSLYQGNVSSNDGIMDDSRFEKEIFTEPCSKKGKVDDSVSSDDKDFATLNDSKKELSPPKVAIQYDMMIAGTKVKFPAKPYPCQIAVMNSLIRGCNKEQNCLLESPTGSGKTLALLCGVLAWQEQYSEKNRCEESSKVDIESSCCDGYDYDDNFFLNSSQLHDEKSCDEVSRKNKSRRVPKVYYGTRTHKQIEQVVRELRKTAYSHKRMTILSSRDRTCIQNTHRNKNELCNELLDAKQRKRCPYYNERNKRDMASFNGLRNLGLGTPWDIEDLVSLGKEIEACPYFAARSLMADAEIIFCPYNYIVDPAIRENMQINLKGDIVIIDEAHNIEDTCREAASVNLKDNELAIAAEDCQKLSRERPADQNTYIDIETYLRDVIKFLKNVVVKENNDNRQEMVSNYWSGAEFLECLNIDNIGLSTFSAFLAASKAAIQDFNEMKEQIRPNKMKPVIARETKKVLEHLCYTMQMITSETFVDDYRVYVIEAMESSKKAPEDQWISTQDYKQSVRTMRLICMNPAIIFAPLALAVRSVILASGTLAPTKSFQSELGTQFPHMLNANHVISKEQVYIRYIPEGPSRKPLRADYRNVSSWDFQDELGNLVVQVCNAVPYGVLCFFSSYDVMYKLHDRWQSNGTWAKLSELKEIFREPKKNDDLFKVMKEYREVIKESSSKSFREACGAILFAVFRGKVAEGIDFSDNEARCVLTIGIPYLRLSADISMKKEYNNSKKSKGLLQGSEWYTINAFRALNQALGRCIRHKNDWGAVLLVDERFQKGQSTYQSYLPKWIKEMRTNSENHDLQVELEDFIAMQVARGRGENIVL